MADAISAQLTDTDTSINGQVIVELDQQRRAKFVGVDQQQPLADGQLRLQFRLRHGQVKFATNAFFSKKAQVKSTSLLNTVYFVLVRMATYCSPI